MSNASVSIIIPAYNLSGYIDKCLDSVLSQTYTDFEIIIINDGSDDGTAEILDAYAKNDARVRVIHKQNEGVSAARNTGISAASGKYFYFFDGDDFAEPHAVEKSLKKLIETDSDVLIYGYYRYNGDKVTQTCLPVFEEGVYENEKIAEKLLPKFIGISYGGINDWLAGEPNGLYVENPALWRCVVKSELIKSNGLAFDINLRIGEDTIFISDLLSCSKRCNILRECLYYLRFREASAIASYEKDAEAKLVGKLKLLESRRALTDRVFKRSGLDITPLWQGTVIMSSLELAFMFAKKSAAPFFKRYGMFAQYARTEAAKKAADNFTPRAGSFIKRIPIFMLKKGWLPPLFFCAFILSILNYKFIRD